MNQIKDQACMLNALEIVRNNPTLSKKIFKHTIWIIRMDVVYFEYK